MNSFKN